jgi:hypothetical protein
MSGRLSAHGSRAAALVAGLLVALLAWNVGLQGPAPGIDGSWNAGLAMAVDDGLHFGTEVVFSYGPLGFLENQFAWFDGLAVLSLLYAAALHVTLCVGLVWALRRRLPLALAALLVFFAVALLPTLEVSLLCAVLASFWLLERARRARALDLFVLLAAPFAAIAALVKLSTGPLVAVFFLAALVGARAGRRRLLVYVIGFVIELLALWLLSGQRLGDLPDFVSRTLEISSGYSSAMMRQADVAAWKVVAATAAAAVTAVALVVAAWFAAVRDRRARLAAALIVALAAFAIFKEGVVRPDAGHLTVFFANACVLWVAVGLGAPRWRWALAIAVLVGAASFPVRPANLGTDLDPVANVESAFDQARYLASPGRRHDLTEGGRASMQATYALELGALAALKGRSVAVEPWEIGAAWAYELDWSPLPVFQNYSAYTASLDRLNAATVADPGGPERILRENEPAVYPEFPGPDLDGRLPAWDPPEQARAVLCNFAPLYSSRRWQVLGRTADRCGAPRAIGAISAAAGEAVPVPRPRPGQAVFVRIGGAGVSGLEKLQTLAFHARTRHLVVDGSRRYRLIPETAGDGLLLRAGRGVAEPGPFAPTPEAATIAVEGVSGTLTYDFFRMTVRPAARP